MVGQVCASNIDHKNSGKTSHKYKFAFCSDTYLKHEIISMNDKTWCVFLSRVSERNIKPSKNKPNHFNSSGKVNY